MLLKYSRSVKAITLIAAGALCHALGSIAERFLPQMPGIDFTVGLMTGMSLTLMLFGMWRFGVERRQTAK
jgi:drug/metabolite transporter (DMT)-like permease